MNCRAVTYDGQRAKALVSRFLLQPHPDLTFDSAALEFEYRVT
jgi:hypothetical protein